MARHKFSIITPCFNAEKYIKDTIESILRQSAIIKGRAELEYYIMDGGSTDHTLKIINDILKVKDFSWDLIDLKVISDDDRGMYDALGKGFSLITGDICTYLNADDYYHHTAFDVVLDIIENTKTKWITGLNITYTEQAYPVNFSLPFRFRQNFIKKGFYGSILPFIQQESTFWLSELNQNINWTRFCEFKYAGDFYLWTQLANQAKLRIVCAYLSGFRRRKGQLSENINSYRLEMDTIVEHKPNIIDYAICLFDKLMWYAPPRYKKRFNMEGLYLYDHKGQVWY